MEFNATFIVSVISFLLFTFFMNEILYKPITKIVDERESLIGQNYDNAQKSKQKTSDIYKQKEDRLTQTATYNKKLTAEKMAEANNQAKVKIQEAKDTSITQINSAKSDLQAGRLALESEMNSRIDELANNISAKVLGEI